MKRAESENNESVSTSPESETPPTKREKSYSEALWETEEETVMGYNRTYRTVRYKNQPRNYAFGRIDYPDGGVAIVQREARRETKSEAKSSAPVEEKEDGNKVVLRDGGSDGGSSVELYYRGAHVTSWKDKKGEELLSVSNKVEVIYLEHYNFEFSKPICGGIPICFPQFSDSGPLETHGFARTKEWSGDDLDVWGRNDFPKDLPESDYRARCDLSLTQDLELWPNNFEFRLRVALSPGGDLVMTSRICNDDTKPFSFTFAYHNYFSVSGISEVSVKGLEKLDYIDNLKGKERLTDQGGALTFEGEVDKTYLNTPTKIELLDHQKKRTIVLQKQGLPDVVIWNPWDKRAEPMADFIDKEHERMLCVEAAAVREEPIELKPGEECILRQQLSVVYWADDSDSK